jgi:hypothetical protein
MKTTLNLNDVLMTKAKATAAQQHMSLTRLIEEGLQLRLSVRRVSGQPQELPVYSGKGGFVPGLDGLSNKALFEAADRDA